MTRSEMLTPGVVGAWSVKDLLAHLTAWEQLFLSWYEAGLRGHEPSTAPVGMSKKAMDELNAQIYAQNRKRSLDEILEELTKSYQQLWATLQTISEEDLFARAPTPKPITPTFKPVSALG